MDFSTCFTPEFLDGYQKGVMNYRYKGILCNKSPLDMAIYLHLLWNVRPATIIEIGYKKGGSAAWFADMGRVMGLDCRVVGVDLVIPEARLDDRVMLIEGDVERLDLCLTEDVLATLPRPWLVVEDSAHTYTGCIAALEFFGDRLLAGEYLIMEDGILDDLGMADKYQGGPNRAIEEYLKAKPDQFRVDRDCCDMFGRNATYNPNGYLVKKG
ncbi:CmcI family methyltransferase [uncultured Marinobacter sp.]|uniref:CmcI family methyltransferase n=1 Tax=uncultured Marinobacter sp. TaxID=187379 RepID=UPI0026125ACA|nr:CmcI family methyltransferase [uncultured Marinobacter sp.]